MIEVSTDRARLDLARVHGWLAASYWATNIPRDLLERAIERSLCFGAYDGGAQVGFARVVTDGATYGYLCDVIVDEAHRGRGVGKALVEAIMAHPDLGNLRRMGLVTRDAHALYAGFGFRPLAHPDRHLERTIPNPYGAPAGGPPR